MTTNMLNISWGEAGLVSLCIIGLVIRDLVRKGIALYKAGQRSDTIWFILIFIFNTCGILPIIYLILNRSNTNKEL